VKDEKRQTLEAAGWTVGDPEKLLEMSEAEKQASRLIHKYGREGALKAVKQNIKKAVSEAQEEFWEDVGDLIEETGP
jgi:hypothetical protein